jgi:integrase/recombinase XerD
MPSNSREVVLRTSGPLAVLNRSLPKYFSVEEVHAVIEQATNPRDHLLLNCLWQTGARISEMLQLKPADVDFTAGTIRLITLKRRARFERAVLVKAPLLGELARHIASKRIQDSQRIFPITRSRSHQIVRKACNAAGITDKRAHPHTFRHSLGVFLIQRLPITVVKEVLGHANIESSLVYTRLVAQDVRKYYEGIEF